MNIQFAGEVLNCRTLETSCGRFKVNDILTGPDGMLLKVVTVQKGCPMWESNRRTFTQLLLETEDHELIPLRAPITNTPVYRPKAA